MRPRALLIMGLQSVVLMLSGCCNDKLCYFDLHINYYYSGPYKVRGTQIEKYVSVIEQYIYDQSGTLRYTDKFDVTSAPQSASQIKNLPEGTYTLVAWGERRDEQVAVSGVTLHQNKLDDGRMTNIARSEIYPGYYGNIDRLYFTTRTFTIGDADDDDDMDDGIKHIDCGMNERYAELIVRINGLGNAVSRNTQLYMQLEGIPSVYDFRATTYPAPTVNHRTSTSTNVDLQVNGVFTTFRYRGDTHPLLSLHDTDGRELMRRIDLKEWFDIQEWQMDKLIAQNFEVEINIQGDKIVIVSPTIDGWELGW